ncbi:swi-snf complex subunit [Lasallia pustulata]|uniref:Swi-snf complex subunit n=1 Tax=Lasallia pustulata TaxID=136370 RepID=A0A1W5CU02_9LECA|nr:swi-snf complex subunit [Lasallia pustulata]
MNTPMQVQYRGYQQPNQRQSHPSSSRRGPGPGPMVSHAQVQSLAQQRSAADKEKENAKRRARQPTDMNIPEGIEDIIIGNGVQEYKALRDLERRLDAVTMRKKLDISDKIKSADFRRYQTLRIWVSNTAENQPWQGRGLDENAFDFSTGIEATYRVKIEGRLQDDDDEGEMFGDHSDDEKDMGGGHGENDGDAMEQDGEDAVQRPLTLSTISPRKKLSDFFKTITVDLERAKNLQPDGTTQIEWKKSTDPNIPSAYFDVLEFERKSDENINCTINLYRDENPERYQLSKELAEVVDAVEATREHIKMAIWEYAKMMGLQQDEDMRFIQCDDRLRAIFKQDTIYFHQIHDAVFSHCSEPAPISLPYTIRVDPEYHASPTPTIYDVLVPISSPLKAQYERITTNPAYLPTLQRIADLDSQIAVLVQAVVHSKARHTFFRSLEKDPANFLRRWSASQKRDLEVILGEATRGGGEDGGAEEFRRGGDAGVWGSETVRESVGLMVAKAGKKDKELVGR